MILADVAGAKTKRCVRCFECLRDSYSALWQGTEARDLARVLSQRDQDRFIYHLTRAIIIGNVPFTFMENEDMQAAAKIVGVKLPSRKVTSTTLLDSTADEVELPTATR